jgi:protease-4
LRSAAGRAKLAGDYRVVYIEKEGSKIDRLLDLLGANAMARAAAQMVGAQLKLGVATTGLPPGAAADIARDLGWLSELSAGRKPFMALTHCLCESP